MEEERLVERLTIPTDRFYKPTVAKTSLEDDEGDHNKLAARITWVLNNKPDERNKYARLFGVPPRYWPCNVKDFEGVFDEYPNWDDNEAGLFITGGPGTGKTHLGVALLFNHVARVADNGVLSGAALFKSSPELLNEIRRTFSAQQQEEDIVQTITNVPLLMLDDVGSERATDWTAEVVCRIITNRINCMRATIVTSNLTLKEIHGFDPRLASRLGEMNYVCLTGTDRRVGKCKEFKCKER